MARVFQIHTIQLQVVRVIVSAAISNVGSSISKVQNSMLIIQIAPFAEMGGSCFDLDDNGVDSSCSGPRRSGEENEWACERLE